MTQSTPHNGLPQVLGIVAVYSEKTPKVVHIMAMFDPGHLSVEILWKIKCLFVVKQPLLTGSERKLKVRTDSLCGNEVEASTHQEDRAEISIMAPTPSHDCSTVEARQTNRNTRQKMRFSSKQTSKSI